jgi:hypothetical protein
VHAPRNHVGQPGSSRLNAPSLTYCRAFSLLGRSAHPGANRWAFKPEVGLSRRWGPWVLDAYGGMWFFTENPEFFYGRGAYIQFGGDYQVLSAAWQYSWISARGSQPSTARTSSYSSSRQE